MEFSVKSGSPEKQRSACIVVGVFEPRRLSPIAEQLDKISDGYISALLRRGELEGKPGQTLLLHHVPNVLSERILLIGCGKERELDERQYKQVIQKTINTLNDTGSMEAVCFLTELHVKGRNTYWKVRQAVETAKESLYSFDQLKTNKSEPRRPLRKMVFNVPTRRELTRSSTVWQSLPALKRRKISATCRLTSVTRHTWPLRRASWPTPTAKTSLPASSANSR